MTRTPISMASMALVVVLGCSGRVNDTSPDASPPGARLDAGGMTDTGTGIATSGGSDASSSSDAIAPPPCDPGVVEAGVASMSDAEVPVNHRPTPACCPAQRGPAPTGPCSSTLNCASVHAEACSSDADCTAGANGRCFQAEDFDGPGGCSYDECFTDSNCGSKVPCLCRSSSADTSPNVCNAAGNCAVDSDCGPGGYCSPSAQVVPNQAPSVCWGLFPYYCHTATDQCINDSDCGPADAGPPPDGFLPYACVYDPQGGRWGCAAAVCALP
jgi:hypothetical protein